MENLNLLLNLRMAGGSDCCIRGAARIKVDGHGALTVYDAGSGLAERIDLAELQSLSIRSLGCTGKAA